MYPDKFIELLKYIYENNGLANLYHNSCDRNRNCYKYVDFSFDTRDGQIWKITFRENASGNMKQEQSFRIESEEDLKKVYEFLDQTRVSK